MIYLDYSATTPVEKEVLKSFNTVVETYIGNPNSLHKLGVEAKKLMDASTKQIADLLNIKPSEIIYTSGASEANNTAIKGIALKYQNRGKHIITTKLEHSSILEPLHYLETLGFEVDYVSLDECGQVNLSVLNSLIREDTILVSIASVNSEIGIKQNIKEISRIIKKYPKVIFHSDMTQSIGKEAVDLSLVDLASMSSQKFYGLKGSGILYKKESLELEPLIHGGKSTTIYRSGTPALSLITSFAKALRLAYKDLDKKQNYVEQLHDYLLSSLKKIEEVHVNSNACCLPYIINISIHGIKPETMLHALEEEEIYVSTQTACSSNQKKSLAVYEITKNNDYALSSIRISISHLTTKEELDCFLQVLKEKIDYLHPLGKRN